MKKLILFFLFVSSINIYSQQKEFKYCIYTIDSLDSNIKVKFVSDEKVSFIKINDRMKVFRLKNDKKTGFTHNKELEDKMIFIKDSLNNIAKIENKNISFFSFYENKTLNFFESFFYLKNKDIFITLENIQIEGVQNLIKFKYGSIKKYNELKSDKNRTEEIISDNLDSLKLFIKKDYTVSQKIFPLDTIKAISLIIEEIDSVAELNIYESELIKRKINEILMSKTSNDDYPYLHLVSLFKKNITNAISEVLDKERFYKCISHFDLYRKIRTNVNNKLYLNYTLKKDELEKLNVLSFDDYLRKILSE